MQGCFYQPRCLCTAFYAFTVHNRYTKEVYSAGHSWVVKNGTLRQSFPGLILGPSNRN